MTTPARSVERIAPRRQGNWDWRAAGNFIAGGAGGGVLACVALLSGRLGFDPRYLLAAGLAMMALGLTCVWFEIGRPWRAMNVFRHAATSWMTREAYVAIFTMGTGLLAIGLGAQALVVAAGLLGLLFIYAQARILAANKGIPAWRHRRCLPAVLSTGLAEGTGLVACAASLESWWEYPAALLVALCAWRVVAWRRYLAALTVDGAPAGTLAAFRDIGPVFVWVGNVVPVSLALVAVLADTPILAVAAGVLAVAAGWLMKYSLVCRAAFTQGFALPKQPVRGNSRPGPGVKPGWHWSSWLTH